MIERSLTYIGFQIAKVRFRGDVDRIQPFTGFFKESRRVLMILPAGYEDAVLAGTIMRELFLRRPTAYLTVLNSSTRETPLGDLPRCEVVRYNAADINRLSLPKKSFIQRLPTHEYDLALDMNLDFILHTAYICKASRARVRVGCAHAAADFFYNVQVNLMRPNTPAVLYRKFAEYVSMF